jgi:MOSC domain-containing protein YiiM
MAGAVEAIHLARSAGEPMRPVDSIRVEAGIGLEGDRYASGLGHFSADGRVSRDVTFVEREAIDALNFEHQIALGAAETRRNLTTAGVNLNALVGRRFYVGDVLCLGTRRCNPCQYLADLTGKPLLRPLIGRGGLRGDLLADGVIRVGDLIMPAPRADLVIGTTNSQKAHQCELALAGLDVDTRRLVEILPGVRAVDEPSEDPCQNARAKASAYAAQVGSAVLALDFALTFDRVDAGLQPGSMVRRPFGSDRAIDDDRLIEHYVNLIERHGGRLEGRWQVGMTVATPVSVFESEVSFSRMFVARRSGGRVPGYPLASLQLTAEGGYVSEFGPDTMLYAEIALPLRRLVAAALSRR